jgi:hypothetical protein
MMRSMATLFPLLLLGAVAACTGDEFTAGSGGGGGAGATTTGSPSSQASSGSTGSAVTSSVTTGDVVASSSTTTGSGGGCAGCIDQDGACHETTSADFCGPPGGDCVGCAPATEECQVAACNGDGACGAVPLGDGAPCGVDGACVGGVCDEDAENCVNGIDDEDDDNHVDCDDDDCEDHSCSFQADDGWEGPFLVIESASQETCPLGLTEDDTHYVDPVGDCDCEPGVDCGLEVVLGALDCTLPQTVRIDDECAEVAFSDLTGIAAIRPYCSATANGAPTSPGRSVLTACQLFEGGCNDLSVCMPPLPEDNLLLCVRREGGDRTCPANFGQQREAWDVPTLECPCKCSISQASCDGTLQTFSDLACTMCGEDTGPCAVIPSPLTTCTAYDQELAGRAAFEKTAGDPAPVVDEQAHFVGDPAVTYCCRDYGPEEK